jgi:hypothetical protein
VRFGALLLVLCGLFAATAAAATPSSVTVSHTVAAVAADGKWVALAANGGARTCERAYLWRTAPSRLIPLGRERVCEITSTGRGVGGVSVAGSRALWITYAGGNTREWTLWTASASSPRPRQLQFVAVDVEEPQPVLVGAGDGELLPYAVRDTVTALRANGARAFRWQAPARVLALAARGGQLAVAYAGGKVAVLSPAGRPLRTETFASDVTSVALTANGLVAQRGRTLEFRGGGAQTFTLAATAHLDDADAGLAVVSTPSAGVSVLRLNDGASVAHFAGTHATLEGRVLYVTQGRTVARRTI